MTNIDHHSILV